jgi:hypothetical protein
MAGEDVAAIRAEGDKLGEIIQKIGASMYQQPEGDQSAGPAAGGDEGPSGGTDDGEDVVDGEFKNV